MSNKDACNCDQAKTLQSELEATRAKLHDLHCLIDDHANRGREEEEGDGVDYTARFFRFAQELADLRCQAPNLRSELTAFRVLAFNATAALELMAKVPGWDVAPGLPVDAFRAARHVLEQLVAASAKS